MSTEAEMMADLAAADAAGDATLAQHIAGRIRAARAAPGVAETAVDHFAHGGLAGFSDEGYGAGRAMGQKVANGIASITGDVPALGIRSESGTFGDLYKKYRDERRGKLKEEKTANPATAAMADVAGSLVPMMVPGVGVGGTLGSAAKLGAVTGAARGLGDTAENDSRGIAETALGAGVGAAGGALGFGVGKVLGPLGGALAAKARDMALNAGRRTLAGGARSMSVRKAVPDEALMEAFRAGAFKPGGTQEFAANMIDRARDEAGSRLGRILSTLEANGVTGPKAQGLAADLLAEAEAVGANGISEPLVPVLQRSARELLTKPTDSAGALGLMQAEEMKRGLQAQARSTYDVLSHKMSPQGEAKQAVAGRFRQAVEDEIAAQASKAPDAAAAFVPAKEQMGRLASVGNLAEEGVNRAKARHAISMYDVMAASAGAGAGHHGEGGGLGALKGGGAGLLLSTLLRTRGPSTAAYLSALASHGLGSAGAAAPRALATGGIGVADEQIQALIDALSTQTPAAGR